MSVKYQNKIGNISKQLQSEDVMYQLSSQVLADCNRYCRYFNGDLEKSSRLSSVLQKGELRWTTPYALRVYYTGKANKQKNPLADLMWCHKAESIHSKDWVNVYKNLVEKKIKEAENGNK